MRRIRYDGAELRLSERDWRQLLNRFDVSKADLNSLGYYHLSASSICAIRKYRCSRCPLRDPYKGINSCTYLLKKIIGKELFQCLFLFDTAVVWEPKYDKEARQGLGKVHSILSSAEKV